MPVFSTFSALNFYVVNVTNKEIANQVKKIAVEKMNEVIAETIYANPSHMRLSNYENTYGMMDRAQANIYSYGNGVVNTGTMVDIDINPVGEYPNMYGTPRNNNDMIVGWLNQRKSGGYYNSRPVKPPNYNMFNKAKLKLTQGGYLKKEIIKYLKSKRYVISKMTSSLDSE